MNINIQYSGRRKALKFLSKIMNISVKDVETSVLSPTLERYEEYCNKYVRIFLERENMEIGLIKVIFNTSKGEESHIRPYKIERAIKKSGSLKVVVALNEESLITIIEKFKGTTLLFANAIQRILENLVHETIHLIQVSTKTLKTKFDNPKLGRLLELSIKDLQEFSNNITNIYVQNENVLNMVKVEGEASLYAERYSTHVAKKFGPKLEEGEEFVKREKIIEDCISEYTLRIKDLLSAYLEELNKVTTLLIDSKNLLNLIRSCSESIHLAVKDQNFKEIKRVRFVLEDFLRKLLENSASLSKYVHLEGKQLVTYKGFEHGLGTIITYVLTKSKQHHYKQKPRTMINKFIEDKRHKESREIKLLLDQILSRVNGINKIIKNLDEVIPIEEQELKRFKTEVKKAIRSARL